MVRHRRHDDAAVGVDEPQLLEQQEQRDHRRPAPGITSAPSSSAEDAFAAREAQLGERIAGRDVERERERGHGDGERARCSAR